jgi:hypothetical protein
VSAFSYGSKPAQLEQAGQDFLDVFFAGLFFAAFLTGAFAAGRFAAAFFAAFFGGAAGAASPAKG